MTEKRLMKITDNDGLIQDGKRLFKIHHYGRQHNLVYQEINPEEYDKRIQNLAETIAKFPDVHLLDALKDALYDLPLKRLEILEGFLSKELAQSQSERREPKIATTTANRGTCVNLAIGGRFAMILRE